MPPFNRTKVSPAEILMVAALTAGVAPATAQPQLRSAAAQVPFTATLSNNTPLVFGMDSGDAARALGAPLSYVSGRAGDEILLAFRTGGGSGFFPRNDRLYLQFRKGRLAGWKGDWGSRWMWQSP
jgi:hypothetical protein